MQGETEQYPAGAVRKPLTDSQIQILWRKLTRPQKQALRRIYEVLLNSPEGSYVDWTMRDSPACVLLPATREALRTFMETRDCHWLVRFNRLGEQVMKRYYGGECKRVRTS